LEKKEEELYMQGQEIGIPYKGKLSVWGFGEKRRRIIYAGPRNRDSLQRPVSSMHLVPFENLEWVKGMHNMLVYIDIWTLKLPYHLNHLKLTQMGYGFELVNLKNKLSWSWVN